ncbi:MAG: redoxin domain-containing protein [Bacteroidales bacterium]|jgi:thiol-disulfide isomerase/thioredoxin|nr:redoxin domain-containing protein [Bacteroidales bacterium]
MKRIKYLIGIVMVFLPQIMLAQKDYDITFWIKDFEDSVLYIKGAFGKDLIMLDSIRKSPDQSFHWTARKQFPRLLTASSSQEDMFSFVLDTSLRFSIGIEPSGFYWVEGCEANEHYLKYQEENRKIRLAEYQYKLQINNPEQDNKDSVKQVYAAARAEWKTFTEDFYIKYPDNLMSVLVRSLKAPNVPDTFLVDGKLKEGKEMQYADYFRTHYWDDFDFDDPRILYTPFFFQRFESYLKKITVQNSDSIFISLKEFCEFALSKGGKLYANYILNYYLNHYSRMPFSFNERIYVLLTDFVTKTAKYYSIPPSELDYHQTLASKIKPFLPGNRMPNITAVDFGGTRQSLYDQKHKYTIVYFWAAGCESCKKDLEVLEEFYRTKKDTFDVEIFSIDLEKEAAVSAEYHRKHPFEWIVLKAMPEEIEQRYGLDVELTPELYILDRNKRILNKTVLYSQIEESLKMLEE